MMFDCTRIPYTIGSWKATSDTMEEAPSFSGMTTTTTDSSGRFVGLLEPHGFTVVDLAVCHGLPEGSRTSGLGASRHNQNDSPYVVLQPHRQLTSMCVFTTAEVSCQPNASASMSSTQVAESDVGCRVASGDSRGVVQLIDLSTPAVPQSSIHVSQPCRLSKGVRRKEEEEESIALPPYCVLSTFYVRGPEEKFLCPETQPTQAITALLSPCRTPSASMGEDSVLLCQRQPQPVLHPLHCASRGPIPLSCKKRAKMEKEGGEKKHCTGAFKSREVVSDAGVWMISLSKNMVWPTPLLRHPATLQEQIRLMELRHSSAGCGAAPVPAGGSGHSVLRPGAFVTVTAASPGLDRLCSLHHVLSGNSLAPLVTFDLQQALRTSQLCGVSTGSGGGGSHSCACELQSVMESNGGLECWMTLTTRNTSHRRCGGLLCVFDIRQTQHPIRSHVLYDEVEEGEGVIPLSSESQGQKKRGRETLSDNFESASQDSSYPSSCLVKEKNERDAVQYGNGRCLVTYLEDQCYAAVAVPPRSSISSRPRLHSLRCAPVMVDHSHQLFQNQVISHHVFPLQHLTPTDSLSMVYYNRLLHFFRGP